MNWKTTAVVVQFDKQMRPRHRPETSMKSFVLKLDNITSITSITILLRFCTEVMFPSVQE
jgi:hypothetical protein